MPPLKEGAVRASFGVCRRQEKIGCVPDELLIVIAELCVRQLSFQPVGNAAAIEAVLQAPVAFVVHDAVGHRCSPGCRRLIPMAIMLARGDGLGRASRSKGTKLGWPPSPGERG